jgi:hypothetical protein
MSISARNRRSADGEQTTETRDSGEFPRHDRASPTLLEAVMPRLKNG